MLAFQAGAVHGETQGSQDSGFVFRIHGEDFSSPHLRRDFWETYRYRRSIERANRGQCFLYEGSSESPVSLNWANIKDTVDLEVCVSYLAHVSETQRQIRFVLNNANFHNVSITVQNPIVTSRLGIEGSAYLISAGMGRGQIPKGFGRWFGLEKLGSYSLSLSLVIDDMNEPYDARALFSRN